MSISAVEPFLAEIRLFPLNFAPKGWAMCEGQLLPINQNQALFSLLGTTFGGDGRVNFALPDMRSRAPIHVGSGFTLGQVGGEQAHTITVNELPTHAHVLNGSTTPGTAVIPTGMYLATTPNKAYHAVSNLTTLNPATLGNVGGSQAHLNMQPFLALTYCIALQGIFPSPN